MAAKEMLSASLLHLRGKATEVYSLIKDTISRPLEVGDSEKIAALAAQLAQLEGAVVTLEHYRPQLLESLRAVIEEEPDAEPDPADPEDPGAKSHANLMERSPTYKKTVEDAELKESLGITKE